MPFSCNTSLQGTSPKEYTSIQVAHLEMKFTLKFFCLNQTTFIDIYQRVRLGWGGLRAPDRNDPL